MTIGSGPNKNDEILTVSRLQVDQSGLAWAKASGEAAKTARL